MMRKPIAGLALLLAVSLAGAAPAVQGDYLEVRSCDVYTGPCFANGEMGLRGHEAVMAWTVAQGGHNGVDLEGLSVIAVVRADGTLGDVRHEPRTAKSVVIVDAAATDVQRDALIALAREKGGALVADVQAVYEEPITRQGAECAENGCAYLKAGDMVEIATRCLNNGDHICGTEEAFYPPLTDVDSAQPAMISLSTFQGDGLDVAWRHSERRGAYLGSFAG